MLLRTLKLGAPSARDTKYKSGNPCSCGKSFHWSCTAAASDSCIDPGTFCPLLWFDFFINLIASQQASGLGWLFVSGVYNCLAKSLFGVRLYGDLVLLEPELSSIPNWEVSKAFPSVC